MTPSKQIDSQVSQQMANNALQMDINNVNDAIHFYNQMQQAGYSYAGWAKGVADGSTTTGRAALDHMQTVAEQELGRKLTDKEINDIRVDMANGYKDAMNNNFDNKKYGDISFEDTKDFHLDTFEKYGLTENAWTLTTPMNVIAELENMKNEYRYGERDEQKALERQEKVWEELRETEGNGFTSLLESYSLKSIVDDFSSGYGYIDDSGNIFSSGEVESSDLANYVDTDDSTYHLQKIEFDPNLVQGAKNWSKINTLGNSIGNLIGDPYNEDISDENGYNPYPTDDEGTPLDEYDNTPIPEVGLTGNEIELPTITVTAESQTNSYDFFNEKLNQYAEEQGFSYTNIYDYSQYTDSTNDDYSNNRTSLIDQYIGKDNFSNSMYNQLSNSSKFQVLEHDPEDCPICAAMYKSNLKLLDNEFNSFYEISDPFITGNIADGYTSKIIYGYVNSYFTENNSDNMNNNVNSNLSVTDDNNLNNNENIAKVSDDPIILIKDENGIDKAMSVSEYVQYQNLLQNSNNAFDNAQQKISEELNNIQQELNQQLDEIASQEENSSIVNNENLDNDIADNLNDSDDMAHSDLLSTDDHNGDSVNLDLSVIDDDIFRVITDEELFAMNYDDRWECKYDDSDNWLF